MRLLSLLRLKLLDLFASPALFVLVLIAPPLLGLIGGAANRANVQPTIRMAVVDQDQSQASQDLFDHLSETGWQLLAVDQAQADRLLVKRDVDGVLTIGAGFGQSLEADDPDQLSLFYTMAEGSLSTTVISEAIAAKVLPLRMRQVFLKQLQDRYRQLDLPLPDDLAIRFDESAVQSRKQEARLDIRYIGAPDIPAGLTTYLVSDYSMEVFFLSIYAVLGSLLLSNKALRSRLAASKSGLLLDYVVSLLALFLIGLVQIISTSVALGLMTDVPIRLKEWGLLSVCLLMMLGLGQLLSLLHEETRLWISLQVLLVLSIASGCFFQLTEPLLRSFGQYLPQGWTLATLYGYPVNLPLAVPLAFSGVLLVCGYFILRRNVKQAR